MAELLVVDPQEKRNLPVLFLKFSCAAAVCGDAAACEHRCRGWCMSTTAYFCCKLFRRIYARYDVLVV
ncbi:hypothetical protein [Sphingomonas phyllosphaerae]|uniref:hypothetical protein n=1 Tax=Sphingomonas phyllosphaerae TaxID=257003 RepID=UPI0024133F64|nr:hypothetical protein [Sphingomonas phyllosphaerae]